MNILDSVSQDLNWREAEIAAMRILLSSPGVSSVQKKVYCGQRGRYFMHTMKAFVRIL